MLPPHNPSEFAYGKPTSLYKGGKSVYRRGGNLPPAVFYHKKYTVLGLFYFGTLQQGGVSGGEGLLLFGFIQGQQ